ncbi:hypothetical protein SAMN02745248_00999 [Hathewaya proteolytica DSM 3090]|uniref:Uncharacterized protein n=1 Tax=Hathewaya proteolytica DSM 3090 TaxID=1121331 RepID=A0A1M6MCJ4_9CLOT|nr:hypothetical protein [Hathewaya proteolytica]SHJ81155.1 hypothetical protein SAMN02745248_00999 [Hathewaya proteolytica DSM 3090]
MGYNNYEKDYNHNVKYGGHGDNNDVVSIGTWIAILILTAIPILNIIGLLVMAFSQGNKNIKNFAKATLLVAAILVIFGMMFKACL